MSVIDFLFGCDHRRYSFPLTIRNGQKCPCYVVCLSCGSEFAYDFKAMKRGKPIDHGLSIPTRRVKRQIARAR